MNEWGGDHIAIDQITVFAAGKAQGKPPSCGMCNDIDSCFWMSIFHMVQNIHQIIFQLADVVDISGFSSRAVPSDVYGV